jgi:hypothetical protein
MDKKPIIHVDADTPMSDDGKVDQVEKSRTEGGKLDIYH